MFNKLKEFALDYLIADVPPLSQAERWRSIMAALIGLLLTTALAWFVPWPLEQRWLLAPMGATAIILFALPHSPLAQPWSVLGGYLMATLAAMACAAALDQYPPVAAVLALAMTVGLMTYLRCLHPPAGGLAFMLVLNEHFSMTQATRTFVEIGVDAVLLMLAAVVVNNLLFRRAYPNCRNLGVQGSHGTKDPAPSIRIGLAHEDLSAAVQKLDTFLDIQESDLVRIYNLAVDHAYDRHAGMCCADVMARDVVTVQFATEIDQAWQLLRSHHLRSLPVVDRHSGRLLGIVTVDDFLRQLDGVPATSLLARMRALLKPTPGIASDKAEVVGQLMTDKPFSVRPETPISDLVACLADVGLHHIPVVDENKRVQGMVTHSDLLAALYKQLALASNGALASSRS